MQNVSFSGLYALPVKKHEDVKSQRFREMLRIASPMLEKDIQTPLNYKKSEYYVHVKDDTTGINDRTFEALAKTYGIKPRKISKGSSDAVDVGIAMERNVKQTKRFIRKAIKAGAPHKIETKNGMKTITIYNPDKGIFGVYKFDASTGKILEKIDYIDGRCDSVSKYDYKERLKSIVFINPNSNMGVKLNTIA